MEPIAFVFGLGSVLATLLASLLQYIQQRRRTPTAQEVTLEQRLDALARTMRESSRLLQQVSAEIEVRAATAERLKDEAQTAEQLAKLNQAQAEAVAKLVGTVVGGESKRSTRQSVLAGALFFIGGVAATVTVTLFVHPLH